MVTLATLYEDVKELVTQYVYPINSVYFSSDSTADPSTLFGGDWQTITTGISGVYGWKRVDNIVYQQVEYLQSNGSQYINTNYILQSGDKVDVTFSSQGSNQYEAIFGARKSSYSTNAYVVFSRFGSSNKIVYNRSGNEKQGSTITTNTIYDVHTDGTVCTVKQNGTTVQTITTTGTANNCVNPCGLFTLNTDSGTGFTKDTYSHMKIYSFKITNVNNEVVMNLIPVRVDTTGYMYDTISETLLENTGTFLYGNDVTPSSYALEFTQQSYIDMGMGTNVTAVLIDNGSPVQNATVTFTWNDGTAHSTTATTNAQGQATANIQVLIDSTVTATYENATATCTVTANPLI